MLVLAERIGGRTADELAAVMSLSELAEWMEHIRLETKATERASGGRSTGKRGGGKIGGKR